MRKTISKINHYLKHKKISHGFAMEIMVPALVLVIGGCATLNTPATSAVKPAATGCLVAERVSSSLTPQMISSMSVDSLKASVGALKTIQSFCKNGQNLNAGEISALNTAVKTLENDLLTSGGTK